MEDLVRAAQSGGGRAALVALELDVDLDVLLAKAGLLALPTLPRVVREALVALRFADVKAFLDVADPADLATKLTTALGQDVPPPMWSPGGKRRAGICPCPCPGKTRHHGRASGRSQERCSKFSRSSACSSSVARML